MVPPAALARVPPKLVKEHGVSIGINTAAGEKLTSYAERMERLLDDIDALKDDLKDLKAQIKGDGYNVVALTRLVAIRRNKRRADLEAELLNDLILYAHATGTPLDVAFAGDDEAEAPPAPARGREAVEDEA
jgi:uncharacterized protein (UPF0335 family)